MAYRIQYALVIQFIPDGAGPLSVPSEQVLKLGALEMNGLTVTTTATTGQPTGFQQVPGGNAPSAANFATAVTAMGVDLNTAITTNLARIQGFATGGG
jgi:hypothetical protein